MSAPVFICERCQGHSYSLLHAICEVEHKLAERAAGWRLNQVRIPEHVKAQVRQGGPPS